MFEYFFIRFGQTKGYCLYLPVVRLETLSSNGPKEKGHWIVL